MAAQLLRDVHREIAGLPEILEILEEEAVLPIVDTDALCEACNRLPESGSLPTRVSMVSSSWLPKRLATLVFAVQTTNARSSGSLVRSTRGAPSAVVPMRGPMDVLSDVLRAVRLTGAVYFDIDAKLALGRGVAGHRRDRCGGHARRRARGFLPCHPVGVVLGLAGRWLGHAAAGECGRRRGLPRGASNVMGSSPELRGRPDLAMYYRPIDDHLPFTLINGGGGDERTRFVCGYLGCDARPFNPLLSALPSLMCVRKPVEGSGWVTDLFRLALAEGGSKRAGTETVLARLSELMFVEVIRRHVEELPDGTSGWLSGLRDPHIGKALRLIHARPARPWTLEELAQEVGLSRTVFASRFANYVAVSPMQYVARWRISPRNAQRVMRFSTMAQIAYITTPMMAMANRPAKVVRRVVARAGRQHQEADAVVAADRLGDHRADEGERDRDLQAGEQIGHGARDADLGQDLGARGAEAAQHVAHLGLDGGEPGGDIDHDREEADDEGGDAPPAANRRRPRSSGSAPAPPWGWR